MHGEDILSKLDSSGHGLIHHAVLSGDLKAVDYIIKKSKSKGSTKVLNLQDSSGCTPLICACMITNDISVRFPSPSLFAFFFANTTNNNNQQQTTTNKTHKRPRL